MGSPRLRSYLNQGFLGRECKVNRVLGHGAHSLAPPPPPPTPRDISQTQPSRGGNDIRSGTSETNSKEKKSWTLRQCRWKRRGAAAPVQDAGSRPGSASWMPTGPRWELQLAKQKSFFLHNRLNAWMFSLFGEQQVSSEHLQTVPYRVLTASEPSQVPTQPWPHRAVGSDPPLPLGSGALGQVTAGTLIPLSRESTTSPNPPTVSNSKRAHFTLLCQGAIKPYKQIHHLVCRMAFLVYPLSPARSTASSTLR